MKIESIKIPTIRPGCGYYLRWYYNGWHYWQFLPGKESLFTEGEKYRIFGTRKITMSSGLIIYAQCQAIRTILNSREVYILTDYGWKSLRIESTQTQVYNSMINGYEVELSAVIGSRDLSVTGFSPVNIIPVTPPGSDQCELIIGTQTWMCKNYDINYPGSKMYDNDEANRAIYGGLYTYDQIVSSGFCPAGWHVPTPEDWQVLFDYIGGILIAGGILKESGITHWNTPNTDAIDTYDFAALPSGYFNFFDNQFMGINELTFLWTSYISGGTGQCIQMNYDTGIASFSYVDKRHFMPVRLIKGTATSLYNGYGLMYNWHAVDTGLLAPVGWHIPSFTEWGTLSTYLGGNIVSGGHMKESGNTHWNIPNVGADNSSSFSAFGNGFRKYDTGEFLDKKEIASFWTSTTNGTDAIEVDISLNDIILSSAWRDYNHGGGIRAIKDSTSLSNGETGMISDIDGNVYQTICIGTQEWMAVNLRVTKYNDGSPISEVIDDATWAALTTGARCWYNNIPE